VKRLSGFGLGGGFLMGSADTASAGAAAAVLSTAVVVAAGWSWATTEFDATKRSIPNTAINANSFFIIVLNLINNLLDFCCYNFVPNL